MARERGLVLFGDFEADLATGELRRAGQRVHVQQQPFQILAALLERPGELVTRHELRRRLWPDGTHVRFDHGVASAMRKLREALGDTARSPVYIETLQRRGYRFIAPVSQLALKADVELNRPSRTPSPVVHSTARWAAVVLIAILIGGEGRFPAGTDDRLLAAESLSAYACVLKSRGERAEALKVIRQAHALVPESARITALLGFYLHAAGQYDEEFPMLYRAVEMDPSSRDVWFHMGLAYARRNDFARAVESLERAKQLGGADRTVDDWLTWARDQRLRFQVPSKAS